MTSAGRGYTLKGELSAQELAEIQGSRELAFNNTSVGALAKVAYGTVTVPGAVSALGNIGSDLIVRVIWLGCGEIYQVGKTFINDAPPPSGVEIRHYRGADWQGVDSWLAEAILLYDDTLVYEKPAGKMGACYSVYRIPDGDISRVPGFSAIIDARLVKDPESAGDGDPFADKVGASVHFAGANGATSATDDSSNAHAITFNGDAEIQSNKADFSGSGYVELPDHISMRPDSSGFCVEAKFTPDSVTGTQYIMSNGFSSPNRGVIVRANNDDLVVIISSDGSAADIMSGVSKAEAFVIGQEYDIKVEHIPSVNAYLVFIDGEVVNSVYSTLVSHATGQGWIVGNSLDGQIRSFRFTKGVYRCGGAHDASGLPFFDTDYFVPGTVYSDNPALCGYEFATNNLYGMGVSVATTGVIAAKSWCDSLLGGTVPRCRISMVIDKARLSEEWFQVIATYGEFGYAFDSSGLTLVPNKPVGADNPSGQELVRSADFSSGDPYTVGAGMFIANGLLLKFGPTGGDVVTSQSLTTEDGVEYALAIDVNNISGGVCSVSVGGVELLSGIATAGRHAITFTAAGTSSLLEITSGASATVAYRSASVRRLKWRVNRFIKKSISIVPDVSSNTPTKTNVRHAVPDPDSSSWGDDIQPYSLPGVSDGDIALRETTIPMPFLFRPEEAFNKAQTNTIRLYRRVRFTAVCLDEGLLFQKGTVIEAVIDSRGVSVDVRLDSVKMVRYGRYRISGYLYSMDNYPSELPEGTGDIPNGSVTGLQGNTVPPGWSVYSDADGKFIVAAGGTYQPGDSGGVASLPAFAGNTTSSGSHAPGNTTKFNVKKVITQLGGGTVLRRWDADPGNEFKGGHPHTYDTGPVVPDLYRRENILIQKTGGAGTEFPASAMVFGLNGLTVANLIRSTAYQGRLLKAAGASINAGVANQFLSFETGDYNDEHEHHEDDIYSQQTEEVDFQNEIFNPTKGGSVHRHAFTLALTRNVKRFRLSLYAGTGVFKATPGMMLFWPLSLGSVPAPWYLCDGANSTPDLRDFFIEVASQGNEGTSEGDNTISFGGDGSIVEHEHDGTRTLENKAVIKVAHTARGHGHAVSGSASFLPEYHALGVMMYNP